MTPARPASAVVGTAHQIAFHPTTPVKSTSSFTSADYNTFNTPTRIGLRTSSVSHSPTSVMDSPYLDGQHCRTPSKPPLAPRVGRSRSIAPTASAVFSVCSPNGKKYKTEMCKNMMDQGYCRFGTNCHYAHSEAERHSTSVEDLMKDDKLLLPCCILVSTGFCPYGHRCKNLHDPKIARNDTDTNVIVLEHCTKAKRNGDTIPDRLYHHQLNSTRQVNPLIAPSIWENCRPSDSRSSGANHGATADDASRLDWMDTYNLVCNAAGPDTVSVFSKPTPSSSLMSPPRKGRTGSGPPRYSDIVGATNMSEPQVVGLGELQKLCIVLQMRAMDATHLDFTYAPVDCMNGQPCMILQTRYFRISDLTHLQQSTISNDSIITEISSNVYHAGKFANPNMFVCAQEVAFDSKGKRTCNLSIWFDTNITACSTTKAKKVSKKDDPWHLADKSGALFCMPNNAEFERSFSFATPPYVSMQPVDDIQVGHDLVKSILEHRVASILLTRGFRFHELPAQLDKLGKDFARLKHDLERWAWPKTSNVDHLSKTMETRNQTEYCPPISKDGQADNISAIWKSFATSLDAAHNGSGAAPKKRLSVFQSILGKADSVVESTALPRIEPTSYKVFSSLSLAEATWREILLGEGGNSGPWKKTIQFHMEKTAHSAPPMMQYSYSR